MGNQPEGVVSVMGGWGGGSRRHLSYSLDVYPMLAPPSLLLCGKSVVSWFLRLQADCRIVLCGAVVLRHETACWLSSGLRNHKVETIYRTTWSFAGCLVDVLCACMPSTPQLPRM